MAVLRLTAADRDEQGFITAAPDPAPAPRAIDPFDHTPLNLSAGATQDVASLPTRSAATDQFMRIPVWAGIAAAAGGLVLAALLLAVIAWAPASPRALPTAVPTRLPPTAIDTGTIDRAPTTPAPTAAPPIAAFFGIGANRAPDIAVGTPLTYTARWGAEWAQVTVPGGGRVWIARGQAAIDDPTFNVLPDAAPQPTPPPAQVIVREVPVAPPCATAADIRFTAPRDVVVDGVPIGHVEGRSCASQDEADQIAELLMQAQIDTYRQRSQP